MIWLPEAASLLLLSSLLGPHHASWRPLLHSAAEAIVARSLLESTVLFISCIRLDLICKVKSRFFLPEAASLLLLSSLLGPHHASWRLLLHSADKAVVARSLLESPFL